MSSTGVLVQKGAAGVVFFGTGLVKGAASAAVQNWRTATQLGRHFDPVETEVAVTDLFTGAFANFYGLQLKNLVARHVGRVLESLVARELTALRLLADPAATAGPVLFPQPWRGIVGTALGTFAAFPFDLVRTRQADTVFKKSLEVGKAPVSIGTVVDAYSVDELFRGVGVGVLYSVISHALTNTVFSLTRDAIGDFLESRLSAGPAAATAVSALLAASVVKMALTPIEIAKKRIQNRTSDAGLIPTLVTMHKEGGVGELYANVLSAPLEDPFMIGNTIYLLVRRD